MPCQTPTHAKLHPTAAEALCQGVLHIQGAENVLGGHEHREKSLIAISQMWLIASVTHLTLVSFPQVVFLFQGKWVEMSWDEIHR